MRYSRKVVQVLREQGMRGLPVYSNNCGGDSGVKVI